MVEKKDPHEAQWKKISALNKKLYEETKDSVYKKRHESCENLLARYC